jgi:DNA-directed RNA polymerase specialized sigma24 family protein
VDIAGLSPKEAATSLGLAPGTVRMRLMRARARLRMQAGPTGPAAAPAGTTTTDQIRGNGND